MKKKIFLMGWILFTSVSFVMAQTRRTKQISLGPEVSFPLTGLTDRFNTGFGGSVRLQSAVADHLNWTAGVGFMNYSSKTSILGGNFSYKLNYIPVKAGLKYFVVPNFYLGGEVGASFQNGNRTNAVYFAYSPGIGSEFPISANNSIELGLRYEGWLGGNKRTGVGSVYSPSNISFVGFRAAFNFNL